MKNEQKSLNRRNFIKKSSFVVLGSSSLFLPHSMYANQQTTQDNINIIGQKIGYTPQVGTLVSMLNWMRAEILLPVQGLSIEDLDYLHDENANTIGAMLWHLAATERFYQIHTFEGRKWGEWDEKDVQDWDIASSLGDKARETIKGNNLEFYLQKLREVRKHTLEELSKRDDEWLMQIDNDWYWGPTNNYCKWFHVCEHESNHNGQFKFLVNRLPSLKRGNN